MRKPATGKKNTNGPKKKSTKKKTSKKTSAKKAPKKPPTLAQRMKKLEKAASKKKASGQKKTGGTKTAKAPSVKKPVKKSPVLKPQAKKKAVKKAPSKPKKKTPASQLPGSIAAGLETAFSGSLSPKLPKRPVPKKRAPVKAKKKPAAKKKTPLTTTQKMGLSKKGATKKAPGKKAPKKKAPVKKTKPKKVNPKTGNASRIPAWKRKEESESVSENDSPKREEKYSSSWGGESESMTTRFTRTNPPPSRPVPTVSNRNSSLPSPISPSVDESHEESFGGWTAPARAPPVKPQTLHNPPRPFKPKLKKAGAVSMPSRPLSGAFTEPYKVKGKPKKKAKPKPAPKKKSPVLGSLGGSFASLPFNKGGPGSQSMLFGPGKPKTPHPRLPTLPVLRANASSSVASFTSTVPSVPSPMGPPPTTSILDGPPPSTSVFNAAPTRSAPLARRAPPPKRRGVFPKARKSARTPSPNPPRRRPPHERRRSITPEPIVPRGGASFRPPVPRPNFKAPPLPTARAPRLSAAVPPQEDSDDESLPNQPSFDLSEIDLTKSSSWATIGKSKSPTVKNYLGQPKIQVKRQKSAPMGEQRSKPVAQRQKSLRDEEKKSTKRSGKKRGMASKMFPLKPPAPTRAKSTPEEDKPYEYGIPKWNGTDKSFDRTVFLNEKYTAKFAIPVYDAKRMETAPKATIRAGAVCTVDMGFQVKFNEWAYHIKTPAVYEGWVLGSLIKAKAPPKQNLGVQLRAITQRSARRPSNAPPPIPGQ